VLVDREFGGGVKGVRVRQEDYKGGRMKIEA